LTPCAPIHSKPLHSKLSIISNTNDHPIITSIYNECLYTLFLGAIAMATTGNVRFRMATICAVALARQIPQATCAIPVWPSITDQQTTCPARAPASVIWTVAHPMSVNRYYFILNSNMSKLKGENSYVHYTCTVITLKIVTFPCACGLNLIIFY